MKAQRIDHICIAVKDLEQARKTYEDVLGLELDTLYTSPREKSKVAHYYLGNVALELMESTASDGEVAKFIERQGEGFFLISYRVANVVEALTELKEKGYKTIDSEPRSIMGQRYAFISYPGEMCGVLTEIIDKLD